MSEGTAGRVGGRPLRTIAFFVLLVVSGGALTIRLSAQDPALVRGPFHLPPFDEMYHARRIVHSALEFPSVLERDGRRGVAGAWCPWPPLYDLAAGGMARALGARTPSQVLSRVRFLPPIVMALGLGLLAAAVARRSGALTGLLAGFLLLTSVPLIPISLPAAIDHHFLEPWLVLALAAAVVGALEPRRSPAVRGLLLGTALCAGLFVQTAFLLAGGVGAAALLVLSTSAGPLLAGALGYSLAGAAVLAWSATRGEGYPVSEWYLGVPHAAALLSAATACLARAAQLKASARRPGGLFSEAASLLLPVGLGLAVGLALPGASNAWFRGVLFLGGDPWLATIGEFRPLFVAEGIPWFVDVLIVGGSGVVALVWAAANVGSASGPSIRRRVTSIFVVAFLVAAVCSRRFLPWACPLMAVAAAVAIRDLALSGRRRLALAAGTLAVLPALVTAERAFRSTPLVHPDAEVFARAAWLLRESPGRGRILGPWSWGHFMSAMSGRGVLIDNFGAAPSREAFEEAHRILLSQSSEDVRRWCQERRVHAIVLQDPGIAIRPFSRLLGLPLEAYLDADGLPRPLLKETFAWRSFVDRQPGDGMEVLSVAADGRLVIVRILPPDPA